MLIVSEAEVIGHQFKVTPKGSQMVTPAQTKRIIMKVQFVTMHPFQCGTLVAISCDR